MVNDIAVQEFVNAIKEPPQDTNNTYGATVSRIDDEGIVWVNIHGSDKETPTASTSTEVKRGDAVTVQWRNNKLYIGGNYSNPSAGVGTVMPSVDYVTELIEKDITVNSINAATGYIGELEAQNIKAEDITADHATIKELDVESMAAATAYIRELKADDIEAEDIVADHATIGSLDTNYAKINAANVTDLSAQNAWVNKIMVQTGLIAHEGAVYELDAIQVNASKIKAGTLDVDRLIVTVDGEKYLVHVDTSTGTPSYEKMDGNIVEPRTITADKIVAHDITVQEITTENLVGTNGWINLNLGRFFYGNGTNYATSTNAIDWNGTTLKIKGDIGDSVIFNNYSTTTEMNTAIGNAVDGIEVGGRNLLLKTGTADTRTITLNSSNYYAYDCYQTYLPVPNLFNVDDLVTISFDWSTSGTNGNFHLECGKVTPWTWGTVVNAIGTRSETSNCIDITSSNQSGHASITFKITSSQASAAETLSWFRIRVDGANMASKTFTISNAKAERGTKATDWTPAPEDVQAEIDAKKSVHTLMSSSTTGSTYANILTWTAEGRTNTSWDINTTATPLTNVKIGDTCRVAYKVSDMNGAYVYVVGEMTSISGSTLTMTMHGLDTTIIDGGNILTNSIGANQIAANSIGAKHLTISDSTNLATANEMYESSLPSYSQPTAISGGYLVKAVATNQYLMVCDFTANDFKQNDELYYEFYGKAATAGSISLTVWGYTGTPPTHTSHISQGVNIALTTSEPTTPYSGVIKLTDARWNTATHYILGFSDGRSTKSQIYIKKCIVRRKNAGELIVDGAITADKLAANSVVVGKMNADTQSKVLNSNISLGGRNLFGYGSQCTSLGGFTVSGTWDIKTEGGFVCAHTSGAIGQTRYIASKIPFAPKPSETMTFSCYVKIKNISFGTTNPMCELYFSGATIDSAWQSYAWKKIVVDGVEVPYTSTRFTQYISDTNWHKFEATATFNYTGTSTVPNCQPAIYLRDATGDLYVRDIKYERGNKATDWTPAPEELAATATNYISADSSGIRIASASPATQKQRMQLTASEAALYSSDDVKRVSITSSTGVVVGNASKGHATVNDTGLLVYDTNNKKRTEVNANGLHVFDTDGATSVGQFGATARIGKADSSRFLMNADSLQAYNSSNKKYFEVSASSMKFGTDLGSTVATTSNVSTAKTEAISAAATDATNKVNDTRIWYATCSTAAATAAKVATISPTTTAFTTSLLKAGTIVNVKFTVTNTAAVADLTLNINSTGAKHIKTLRYGVINNIAGVGYLAKDTTYQFTYDGTYWVMQENYNSDTQNRTRWQNVIAAAEAITNGHIICGTASGYRDIAANVSFDMAYPLLYAATAIAKGATSGTRDNNFLAINGINASSNGTITSGAANKVLYLKGTLTGNTFKISASPFMTTVVPTSQDNICYIPLGIMYSGTNIYFKSSDQIYAYKDGAFGPIPIREASAAAKTATTYITHIDNNGIRVHPSSTQNNSVVINASGMEVFKGGTAAANSVAFYGDTARIGKDASGASRTTIAPSGMQILRKVGTTDKVLANIGYGSGTSESGTADAPYYSFGTRTGSVGNYSFTTGLSNTASGYCSFAGGENCQAPESDSFVYGYRLVSNQAFQAVFGHDNDPNIEGEFIIGNGIGDNSKGNSMTLSLGDLYLHGSDVRIRCRSPYLSTNGVSIAKPEELFSSSRVSITNASYEYKVIRLGWTAMLIFRGTKSTATAAGANVFDVGLNAAVPIPMLNYATSATHFGSNALTGCAYNGGDGKTHVRIRNASTASLAGFSDDLIITFTYFFDPQYY